MQTRRKTRLIKVGSVSIGGDAPVSVQSMTKTDTNNVKATVSQIQKLAGVGCEIIRVAVKDMDALSAFAEIKSASQIPVIADIHFDYKLAIGALEKGADAVRINPGNVGGEDKFREVINCCKEYGRSMRVGVNSGSIEKDILEKHGRPDAFAMVESALRSIEVCEREGFKNFKVSLKGSDVLETINANREFSKRCDAPLHLGITEAGTLVTGSAKSGTGIGIMLYEGIGDTIRVSLTGDPINEVKAGFAILRSLKLRDVGVDVISCPTCSRREVDVEGIATEVENALSHFTEPLTVAVMGCVVNGPGEAKEADIGVAGGKGVGILFMHGVQVKKIKEKDFARELIEGAAEIIRARKKK